MPDPAPPARRGPEWDRRPDHVADVVLGAEAGRRFGAVEQLAVLDGRPLPEHAVATVASDPAVDEVGDLDAGADVDGPEDLAGSAA